MNSLFWFFFQRPTALAKIVGAFRIGFRNNQTNNDLKQDLLVMENLFYNCSISQVRFVIVPNESSMRLWMIIYFIYSFQEKRTEYWRFFFYLQTFDLKGSMRNRLVNPSKIRRSEQELVLLDENLLKCTCLNYHIFISTNNFFPL